MRHGFARTAPYSVPRRWAAHQRCAEGVNNKVKLIKRRAYGLPSFEAFRERVLLVPGRAGRSQASPARTIASVSNICISVESWSKTACLAAFHLAILAAPYM